MSAPLVSVIIPSFDRPQQTMRAVKSALQQTMSDLEILVIDDASETPLNKEVFANEPRVRLIRHEQNKGAAGARNTGIRDAKGTWLAFLDSDDIWPEKKLELQLDYVSTYAENEFMAVASGWRFLENGMLGPVTIPKSAQTVEEFASGCWFCPGSTLLMCRDVALRLGPQNEMLRRLEDYEWFLRFGQMGGRLVIVPLPLAEIDLDRHASLPNVRKASATIEAIFCHRKTATRISSRTIRKRVKAYLALTIASAAWYSGAYRAALVSLFRSILLRPRCHVQTERFWTTNQIVEDSDNLLKNRALVGRPQK